MLAPSRRTLPSSSRIEARWVSCSRERWQTASWRKAWGDVPLVAAVVVAWTAAVRMRSSDDMAPPVHRHSQRIAVGAVPVSGGSDAGAGAAATLAAGEARRARHRVHERLRAGLRLDGQRRVEGQPE